MNIRLYNTLTKKIEIFEPLKSGEVSMYHCGPTVYNYAHIGNLRTYVFSDILRRVFEFDGYDVHQVMNITDVGHLAGDADSGDDKMTQALRREGKPLTLEAMKEVATFYFGAFVEDLKALNIELPHEFPLASEHIQQDIELISELEKKGIAYKISDGVYFDISKFPGYGKLGNISIEGQKDGARISLNAEKKNPADFALWKFDATLGWESPWGRGFPGWHVECSAMSRKYLGQPFDIHTGGIDHIPVHHNNEIAQSEAAYGTALAQYWMHGAFITINDSKMAKSEGNFITLKSLLEESISPITYRYWLLTAHYRSPINFSLDAVRAAQTGLIRLMATVSNLPGGGIPSAAYTERFLALINADLDMPKAIALVWDLLKDTTVSDADKRATILDFDRVFGLNLAAIQPVTDDIIPPEIHVLAEAREEARKAKDWVKADALRAEIEARGYQVMDGPEGIKIVEV
jgi:cysteinyl-tRNA synthetase